MRTPLILAELMSFRRFVSHMHPSPVRDRLAHSQLVSTASQPQRLLVVLLKYFHKAFESCRCSLLAFDPRLQQSQPVAGILSDILTDQKPTS